MTGPLMEVASAGSKVSGMGLTCAAFVEYWVAGEWGASLEPSELRKISRNSVLNSPVWYPLGNDSRSDHVVSSKHEGVLFLCVLE